MLEGGCCCACSQADTLGMCLGNGSWHCMLNVAATIGWLVARSATCAVTCWPVVCWTGPVSGVVQS